MITSIAKAVLALGSGCVLAFGIVLGPTAHGHDLTTTMGPAAGGGLTISLGVPSDINLSATTDHQTPGSYDRWTLALNDLSAAGNSIMSLGARPIYGDSMGLSPSPCSPADQSVGAAKVYNLDLSPADQTERLLNNNLVGGKGDLASLATPSHLGTFSGSGDLYFYYQLGTRDSFLGAAVFASAGAEVISTPPRLVSGEFLPVVQAVPEAGTVAAVGGVGLIVAGQAFAHYRRCRRRPSMT
jgi:hypothetical protein